MVITISRHEALGKQKDRPSAGTYCHLLAVLQNYNTNINTAGTSKRKRASILKQTCLNSLWCKDSEGEAFSTLDS